MHAPSLNSLDAAVKTAPEVPARVMVVLSLLLAFASISTDLYLPAMPAMAHDLGARPGLAEWTVATYLAGFTVGQLVWGPIGDRFGRRLPIVAGMALFVLGSAGCALSPSIAAVIAWRVVQALGAAAGVVLGRAMVRDLFDGPRAAKAMAVLMTVMAIAPLLGPLLGGQLLAFGGWRATFAALTLVGIAAGAAVFALSETLPVERRLASGIGNALSGYRRLARDRTVVGYASIGGAFFAAMFAYVAASPGAYIGYYHVAPAHYGLLFALGVVGIMASNIVNARLVETLGIRRLVAVGVAIASASGLLLATTASTGVFGLAGLVLPLFLLCCSTGLIVANCVSGALAGHPREAGTVSALIGAAQYGGGIVGSALVGLFADGTPRPMALVIALAGLGCVAALRMLPAASAQQGGMS